jgi:integrase
VDPSTQRKTNQQAQGETFEVIARDWTADWRRPIREVPPPELLAALRKIEARGHHETAHRAKQKCRQVFRYAIATGRAERDISPDLRGALVPLVFVRPPYSSWNSSVSHIVQCPSALLQWPGD